jgi:hypothetical protein
VPPDENADGANLRAISVTHRPGYASQSSSTRVGSLSNKARAPVIFACPISSVRIGNGRGARLGQQIVLHHVANRRLHRWVAELHIVEPWIIQDLNPVLNNRIAGLRGPDRQALLDRKAQLEQR